MHAHTKLRAMQKNTKLTIAPRHAAERITTSHADGPTPSRSTHDLRFTMQTQNPDMHMVVARKTTMLRAPKPRLNSGPWSNWVTWLRWYASRTLQAGLRPQVTPVAWSGQHQQPQNPWLAASPPRIWVRWQVQVTL